MRNFTFRPIQVASPPYIQSNPGGNWPSKTGNPSGGGRGNAPSKKGN